MVCAYNAISYNGYIFDGFTKSSINTELVKDDGGNIVKYARHTLEVDFIISVETCRITFGQIDKRIDYDMNRIKDALAIANKSIAFYNRGYGTTFQYDLSSTTPTQSLLAAGFGPFPEVLQWEPLAANKAARCKWRCVFYTNYSVFFDYDNVYSEYKNGKRLPANAHNTGETVWDWRTAIQSVTEEQEVDINEEGFLQLTLKGVIEFVNNAPVTQLINFAGQTAAPNQNLDLIETYLTEPGHRRAMAQDLAKYFEPYLPRGFTRKQRYVYNKTCRQLEFVIVDTEQKCPEGKFPRIIDWRATHKVSSTLGSSDSAFQPQGFLTWENLFTGSFTVAPGHWKGWAWVAMLVLVKQRINCSISSDDEELQHAKDELDGVAAVAAQAAAALGATQRKELSAKHFLTDVSITDNLHDNTTEFSLRYIVVTSLAKLFNNTGLFFKVHSLFASLNDGETPLGHPKTWTPKTRNEILERNKLFDRLSTNAVGYNGLGLANYNIIFDPNNLNLPSRGDDNGNNLPWTGPPNPYLNTPNRQSPSIYTSNRRNDHYVEHNLEPYQEVIPEAPPQPVESVGGTPPNAAVYPVTPVAHYPGADSKTATWMKNLKPDQSWAEYKVNFELVEVSNASYLPTIQAAPLSEIKGVLDPSGSGNPSGRNFTAMTINNKITAEGAESGQPNASRYTDHAVIAHGKPTYYLKFTGKATRVGYRIPMPVVGGLQNATSPSVVLDVYRVGKQYWSQRQVAQSADMPVFEAEWSITYAIQGDPTCTNLSFKHLRQSEFV